MPSRSAWVGVILAAVGVVLLLGFTGNMTSIAVVDRLTNPDARRYWEGEDEYARRLIEDCPRDGSSAASACQNRVLDQAVKRGYISVSGR